MPKPTVFQNKNELIAYVLQYYREHARTLSGRTEAITQLWPQLSKRLPRDMRDHYTIQGIAQDVGLYATKGTTPHGGWEAGTFELEVVPPAVGDPAYPAAPGRSMPIIVEREEWVGPTEKDFLAILDLATYSVADGHSKKLLEFTVEDFSFVVEGLEAQEDGLRRRAAALRYGACLLVKHDAATVEDLPFDVQKRFATEWQHAVDGRTLTDAAD